VKARALAVAAAAVVALVAGLIIMLRSPAPRPSPSAAAPAPGPAPAPALAPAPAARPSVSVGEPVSPSGEPARPASLPPVGDPIVRDHRMTNRPAPPSPIVSATIAELRQVVEPAMRACARDAQIANPPVRVFVHARVRSEAGRVSVHDVTVEGAEPLGPEVAACFVRAYQELQSDAVSDQQDGEDLVHMPWTFP
jgi:hypothetical protein